MAKNRLKYALQVAFLFMVALQILNAILRHSPNYSWMVDNLFYSLAFIVAVITTFVLSIIHLFRYKKKAFAIVTLILSSIGILIILVGLVYGTIIILNSQFYQSSEFDVDIYCSEFCAGIEGVTQSETYFHGDVDSSRYMCHCLNAFSEVVVQKEITLN